MTNRAQLERALGAAIDAGEIVRILYRGGSRPGAVREIRPIAVTGDELRAHDLAAGLTKVFLLARVELTDAPVTPPDGGPHTVDEAVKARIPELQALGWHVELTTNAATLHPRLKNGKPRKAASASLWFEEYTGIGIVDDGPGSEAVVREERWKSRAPYHVSSTRLATRSFANLWKATTLFLEEARRVATKEGRS